MNHMRVKWKHELPSEPIFIYSEVDESGRELRKVEVFASGAMGYASEQRSAGGTGLSTAPVPSLSEIATDPQFEPMRISPDEFDRIWTTATAPKSPGFQMLLKVEKKAPVENAKAADVRALIPKLRSHGPFSYASLTDALGNYLQVAGGGVTCMLEWRDAINRRHYRAHLDTPSKVFPDGTILAFSGGEVKLQSDEWLTAPMVEDAFLAFLNGDPLPPSLQWRDISAMFDNLA